MIIYSIRYFGEKWKFKKEIVKLDVLVVNEVVVIDTEKVKGQYWLYKTGEKPSTLDEYWHSDK